MRYVDPAYRVVTCEIVVVAAAAAAVVIMHFYVVQNIAISDICGC